MTEKQLIAKLQTLKEIKPRKDWVLLVKNEMFNLPAQAGNEVAVKPPKASFTGLFLNRFKFAHQSKMAYSFAALLFIFVGALGFAQHTLPGDALFSVKKITEQSQAALTGETNVKSTFETLKKRSKDLAIVKTQKDGNVSSATKEVNDAAKSLTEAIQKDPALAKEVAMEITTDQTLLAVFNESDLKETSDILYQALDDQMIEDLQKRKKTLTLEEQEKIEEILALYDEKKYSQAFEMILLMNNAD